MGGQDYAQLRADWLLVKPTIQSSATSGRSDLRRKEGNTLYSSTLNLALQALCLPLPRFCADITSHPRGCISDATTRVTRTPKPVRMKTGPAQNQMREGLRRGERLGACDGGYWVVSKEYNGSA